uniref:Uncharacterized protein n=1 Tax=Arundo donax TaxID=35708 RepID=A0A0A8YZJ3_ARUDO
MGFISNNKSDSKQTRDCRNRRIADIHTHTVLVSQNWMLQANKGYRWLLLLGMHKTGSQA